MPRIFHVNWFRTDQNGKFLWPGFGENIRVLDWIIRRVHGEQNNAEKSPIGYIPKEGELLIHNFNSQCDCKGAQWLSGRVLDSRQRGRGFEPHRRHCVVVLEQDTYILA